MNIILRHQLRAFAPSPLGVRKFVLSTNIAETSVTISGIKYVIDSGFVKTRLIQPSTGIEMLKVLRLFNHVHMHTLHVLTYIPHTHKRLYVSTFAHTLVTNMIVLRRYKCIARKPQVSTYCNYNCDPPAYLQSLGIARL